MTPELIVAITAAVAAPLVSYLLAARKMSGKISTTEAATLWSEAGKLREEYRGEVDVLRKDVRESQRKIREQETTIENHEVTIEGLCDQLNELKQHNEELKSEVGALTAKVEEQAQTIAHLEAELAIYKDGHGA